MNRPYAFYKSLRFRFGAVFGSLFLIFLLLVALFLYLRVKRQFENSFVQYLESGAELVLGKTELNPLTVPVPQTGEQYLLLYDNGHKIDTLFKAPNVVSASNSQVTGRSVTATRTLETGGRFIIHYSRSAAALQKAIGELRSVLFFYLPIAFLLSLLAGYSLSGFLLRPIGRLINQANQNALQKEIVLLPVPEVADELHALTVALNHMLNRLQEGQRQQNAFFASAAHELRTPLSVMLTGLQVAQPEQKDPVDPGIIEQQLREVRRLSGLVDNLLLMSRLASGPGEIQTEKQTNSLPDAVFENIGMLNGKAASRNQKFKVELSPPEANFTIAFQTTHLNILLRNLLDNAIIHGMADNVIVVRLLASRDEPVQLLIQNKTSQKTIDLSRVTKEFEKGDPFREGFGLGLWIVQELAGRNNATVSYTFRPPEFVAKIAFIEMR